MVSRYLLAGLAAILLSVQSGCWPCGKNWCGGSCGERFCHEWFSLPPDCCDPCTNCGSFCGPNNRFLRRGVFAKYGGAIGPYYDDGTTGVGPMYDGSSMPAGTPTPATAPRQPTPATPREAMPSTSDFPSSDEFRTGEELPPMDASSDVGYDRGYGRSAAADRQFDSRRPSRTLGRPYPGRRYTR
jgi:hypothetical protein